MRRYLSGAVAGVIATVIMTIAIEGGKLLGLLRTPPPTEITTNVTNRMGLDPEPPDPGFNPGTLVAHAGFGVVAGALYVPARRMLPRSTVIAGLIWGGLVWLTAYGGYLPALRLYPWPDDDRSSRAAVMIVAHGVYGVSLAEAEERLREWR